MGAYRVEVFGVASYPGGPGVEERLALNLDAIARIVGLHWSVRGDANPFDTGDGVKPVSDVSVESFNLGGGVTRCLRVEMDNVPVRRIEFEVNVPELVEALNKHACSGQQHQSKSRLQHDEAAL